jgi:hypothetical protein
MNIPNSHPSEKMKERRDRVTNPKLLLNKDGLRGSKTKWRREE